MLDAKIYTGEGRIYSGPKNHGAVNRGASEYVWQNAHANGREFFRISVRRGYCGICHKMS